MRIKRRIVIALFLLVMVPAGAAAFIDGQGTNRFDIFDGVYVDPQDYLESGPQSTISLANQDIIDGELGDLEPTLDALRVIYEWKRENFNTNHAKGEFLGTQTVDNLITTRVLTGCNDHALLVASVARHYGVPAVLVNAAGIQWAIDYTRGKAKSFSGHAFVEVYIDGIWILVDVVTGQYIIGYDPTNPGLPLPRSIEPIGYYCYLKGRDLADNDVYSRQDLTSRMKDVAPVAAAAADNLPYYETSRLTD